MTIENPTADSGASIEERIESLLTRNTQAEEPKQDPVEESPGDVPETAEEAPASDVSSEAEEPQISLSDVAKFLGVDESAIDVDDDGGVKVKTKIDGIEGSAKFKDLVKSYQLQGHVDAKAREAAEQQKALQERVSQFEAYAQAETQRLNQLANVAHQELMRDLANIDWQNLAAVDPATYVQKQAEMTARKERVDQILSVAHQQQEQARALQQQRIQHEVQSEANRLPTLIPEWADEKVAKVEREEMVSWLKTQGATQEEISGITKASAVALIRKAWLFDKGQSKAAVVEKQVRTAPKLVRPGKAVDAKERAEENVRGLKDAIRKSGGKRGIEEYLMATGKV